MHYRESSETNISDRVLMAILQTKNLLGHIWEDLLISRSGFHVAGRKGEYYALSTDALEEQLKHARWYQPDTPAFGRITAHAKISGRLGSVPLNELPLDASFTLIWPLNDRGAPALELLYEGITGRDFKEYTTIVLRTLEGPTEEIVHDFFPGDLEDQGGGAFGNLWGFKRGDRMTRDQAMKAGFHRARVI